MRQHSYDLEGLLEWLSGLRNQQLRSHLDLEANVGLHFDLLHQTSCSSNSARSMGETGTQQY